jgi:protein-S-isoprenylcysteine O-methyltransferase Ste14
MTNFQVLLQVLMATVSFAVMMFGSAGRLDLPMVWAFLFVYSASQLAAALAVKRDSNLAEERMRPGQDAKKWDRVWLSGYALSCFAMLIVAGLDIRFGWPGDVPLWGQIAGLVGFAVTFGFSVWAMSANTFFSRVVRIQRDRGHHVIAAGPYQHVRHPSYLASILGWFCTALALGSWWAMLPATLVALQFILRTALEDKMLQEELDGYKDYAVQVRYRLLPGVW